MTDPTPCIICAGTAGDAAWDRVQVWEDALWRLTVSLSAEVPGFAYLEPKRHVPHVTDLDGAEAASFGPVLARCTRVLREATGAEVVYVYIFGNGIPHLHVHLAPHRQGDALNDQFVRGEVVEEKLPSGMTRIVSKEFPPLPREELTRIAEQVRQAMS
ncbi:MAG TPA: HIT family protein [Alphaproteobacteria bacterium]|nr:HIT family protein [Alphaproteobacteria bacterium]